MNQDQMIRVNKSNPCPICEKPDWCLVAPDGSAAICARIEQGSVKRCGDAGYLHILIDRPKGQQHCLQRRFTIRLNDRPDSDFMAIQQQYSHQMTSQQVNALGQRLEVSTQSLKRLRTGWDGQAYTFPMSDFQGRIIGIRRRFPNGHKVSLKGSKTGLFIPSDLSADGTLLICEGPTDTAAALDIGFDAIGRPNCNSKIKTTTSAVKHRGEIVIIADNDPAGRAGAGRLADILALHCKSVKIVYPPDGIKDLRQWLHAGLDLVSLRRAIGQVRPVEIKITIKD